MSFQIKDDLFDFGDDNIGKPTGIDIKEKKMTLPLIYTLKQVSKSEKNEIINTIRNHSDDPVSYTHLPPSKRKKEVPKWGKNASMISASVPFHTL